MKTYTKNTLHQMIRSNGGEGHYCGKTRTMYIDHIKDQLRFNVIIGDLFKPINIIYQ
jgi:hypothetical protein